MSGEEDKEEALTSCMPKEVGDSPISDSDKFVYQILNGPNEQCLENFRMDKPVFYKLCDILQTRGLLRHTNRIKIEEQLAIFLFIVGHNLRTRAVQELFRYSGETISRHFNNVLNAVMAISMDFFQSTPNPNPSLEDDPYFKDCLGVKKEGVVDSSSFMCDAGKYYIVDSKYQSLPGFMAPYHGASEENQGETEGHEDGEAGDSLRLRDEIASHLWNHYLQNLSTF
ncbi:unnamed protein product [Thlaspi arvense]|uniref:DUF8040 domain-containing protein n=1 Tax=Thlaspi arvense TaxID=13288 RepID=A0AAU9TBX8_THLAR|nr:unnamed protein product [Thlaspi arvense]